MFALNVRPFKRGKIILERGHLNESIWKEKNTKMRITFAPTVQFNKNLGFKPAFITATKATTLTTKPLLVEHKDVKFNGNDVTLIRKTYSSFIMYYSKTAWMNSSLFEWECERLSKHLRRKYPSQKFALMLDNVGSHKLTNFSNLQFVFLPKNSTAITQPLDCSRFAALKNKYSSWLMRKYVDVGAEQIPMEESVHQFASIFNDLDIRVINNGFKKTQIKKFLTEETIQIDISREEQLMNIIERMEKFRCDDSDDE